jgi:hypothetical protein
MEGSVAFESFGFYALLVLNRLNNQCRISETQAANERDREKDDKEKEQAGAALELRDRVAR